MRLRFKMKTTRQIIDALVEDEDYESALEEGWMDAAKYAARMALVPNLRSGLGKAGMFYNTITVNPIGLATGALATGAAAIANKDKIKEKAKTAYDETPGSSLKKGAAAMAASLVGAHDIANTLSPGEKEVEDAIVKKGKKLLKPILPTDPKERNTEKPTTIKPNN